MVQTRMVYSRPSVPLTGKRALLLCLQWQNVMSARVAKPGQRRKIQGLDNMLSQDRAWVAKPGQRRRLQGPVPQGFGGSNPFPRIWTFSPHIFPGSGEIPGRCALDP
jgi:hypothetical protein